MKYILLIAFMACSYAQYPNTRYTHNDFEYYISRDSLKYKNACSNAINIGVWQTKDGKYQFDYPYNYNAQTQIDSSNYYKSKQTYWEKKMKKESKRLDRLKTPQLSQELLDYQDSSIHYKLLLEKYIK